MGFLQAFVFRCLGSRSRTKDASASEEGRGHRDSPARLEGGGKGGAHRGHREPTDNGIPGTKNNNQVFAFISRMPAAASGSRAEGGAPNGARPGLRTAQVGPRAGSAYLTRLFPVLRRVPSGSAKRGSKSRVRWEGWGRRRAREITATSSHPEAPEGQSPAASHLAPYPAFGAPASPTGPRGLWGLSLRTRTGDVRSAPTPSPTPSASIPPQHPAWSADPSRPPRTPPQQPATPRPSPSSRSAAPGVCTGEAGNALFPVRFPAQKLVRGGCSLYSPLRLPPQLGSSGGSADIFPLLPGLENLRLRRETASGVKARHQLIPRADCGHTLVCSPPASSLASLSSNCNLSSGSCAPTSADSPGPPSSHPAKVRAFLVELCRQLRRQA